MPDKRSWLLVLVVFLIPVIPWLVLGWQLEPLTAGAFASENGLLSNRMLTAMLGLAVLAADSFLPVPSTLVMSAIGYALGPWLGGIIASGGVFLSGCVAYGVCRRFGISLAERIADRESLERIRVAVDAFGALVIAVTRSVPILQEASACFAGLARMPFKRFCMALAVGSVPTGFAYAFIGAAALESTTTAIVLSILIPALSWPLLHLLLRSRKT